MIWSTLPRIRSFTGGDSGASTETPATTYLSGYKQKQDMKKSMIMSLSFLHLNNPTFLFSSPFFILLSYSLCLSCSFLTFRSQFLFPQMLLFVMIHLPQHDQQLITRSPWPVWQNTEQFHDADTLVTKNHTNDKMFEKK